MLFGTMMGREHALLVSYYFFSTFGHDLQRNIFSEEKNFVGVFDVEMSKTIRLNQKLECLTFERATPDLKLKEKAELFFEKQKKGKCPTKSLINEENLVLGDYRVKGLEELIAKIPENARHPSVKRKVYVFFRNCLEPSRQEDVLEMKCDTIIVLDFGGQYCHLIGRRVREHSVYSEVVPHDITPQEIETLKERFNVKGLILSGGPASVYEKDAPRHTPVLFDLNLPILGLCYGHQLIAQMVGGKVEPAVHREYGIANVIIDRPMGVLEGLSQKERVWMSHGDTVFALPNDYEVLAHSENTPVAAFRNKEKPIYGLQWHPEVVHTEHGTQMLRNFLFDVCKCEPNWLMADFIKTAVEEIRQIINRGKAIVALSGGIDSSTVTALAAKALGKNLTSVFVDHGFMREDEPEFVESTFGKLGINFVSVKAKKQFLQKLKNVSEPEEKRKIIGREFVRIFEAQAEKVGAKYLIQGTIYPDRIESGIRKFSDKIKTHHNVAGLPTKMEFKQVVEPLRDLYKDEVRKVAEKLGMPKEIVWRQPFPGPGLAVRVTGEVTKEKVEILRKADHIVTEEIEKARLKDSLWQYFAVLTTTKSTGVKGDARAYGYTVAVRAVESREAMTASFAKIPYDVLERISTRVTNEIPQVVRVVYDITHKPPATIEWE